MNILTDYKQYLMFKFCTLTTVINGRELKYNIETNEIWGQNYKFKDKRWEVKSSSRSRGYLCMTIGSNKYALHRVIYKFYNPDWDIEDGSHDNSIDHINGHIDDNRIANLRNLTHQQNAFNRTKAKGYCWDKRMKKWTAQICVSLRVIHLGYFDLEEDARNAYLEAKKVHHIITPIRARQLEPREQQ